MRARMCVLRRKRTKAKNRRKKIFLKKVAKMFGGKKISTYLCSMETNNLITFTIMTKKSNRANSAKETAKRVNNRRAAAAQVETTAAAVIEDVKVETIETKSGETAAAVIEDVAAVDVETVETQAETAAAVVALPAVKEKKTGTGKVTSREVLKAAGSLRAAVKEERRGANCTIRLIAERAASGDAAAVNILCALCDVPRSGLFSLNIDKVRAAVNAYYPYYVETDGRKVSVKPAGVWYSTENGNEEIEAAAKRVQRGYVVTAVTDYLDQLILAAKCRAKGVTPRRVDVEAVYSDNKLSTAAVGISAAEIDEAKARRAYSPNAANVWKKDRNGFYI